VINIAHASRIEQVKLQLKKLKKQRKKEQAKTAHLSDAEKNLILSKKYEKSLKDQAQTILWDFSHQQIPIARYVKAAEILKKRIFEIKEVYSTPIQPHMQKEINAIQKAIKIME